MNSKNLDIKDKTLLLIMILAIFIAMLVPVYQASQMRALESQLMMADLSLISVDAQTKELEASLSSKVNISSRLNSSLKQLNFEDARLVSIR